MNKTNSTEPSAERHSSSQNLIVGLGTALSIIAISTSIFTKSNTPHLLRLPDVFKSKLVRRALKKEIVALNDIKVPADMWRRPSDFPSWNPVPLPNCCNNPRAFKSSGTHSSKFLCTCNSKEDTVRYYGPSMGYTPDDLKNALSEAGGDLIMIGDSLTRQWFESLSCYLGAFNSWNGFTLPPFERNRFGLEADITESFMRFRPEWRKRGNLGKVAGQYSGLGEFGVPSTMSGAPGQRVMFHQVDNHRIDNVIDLLTYYDQRYPNDFKRKRPIFVINYGMHYNIIHSRFKKDGARRYYLEDGEKELRIYLETTVQFCRDVGARCIFRETTPQHFNNPKNDGLFIPPKGGEQTCMLEPPESFDTLNRWRNDVLYDVIDEVGTGNKEGGFFRVMPLFDKLAGLSYEHHCDFSNDCTHYKMDPELWEPWHISLTDVLRDVVTEVSR